MSYLEAHWYSRTLDLNVVSAVLMPDIGEPPFSVFYLLHGLSDDHTGWMRLTRIEAYIRSLPLIVVMPQAFRSFYINDQSGGKFGDYIANDLPQFIERTFPARTDRAARCIGGLSMGGYGAMKMALKYPKRFVSANSHSGALLHGSRMQPRKDGPMSQVEFNHIFGANPVGTENDLNHLAKLAQGKPPLPKLLIDCGTDDFLIQDNRDFHATLTRLNIPHEYHEFPGAHSWDYWDTHICDAIAFHCAALGIEPK